MTRWHVHKIQSAQHAKQNVTNIEHKVFIKFFRFDIIYLKNVIMSCFSTIDKKVNLLHGSNLLKNVTDKIVKNYYVNRYIVYIFSL